MTLRRFRAVPLGLLGLLGLLVLPAAPALAHAMLVSADPADGEELDLPPDTLQFAFNEPVELAPDGVRLFDGSADRVELELVDDGDPTTVTAAPVSELPDGAYVVTYRVVSMDSHPVAGVQTFQVGDVAEVDDAVLAELVGGTDAPVASALGQLLRGLGYVAALLAAGAVAFAAWVARTPADRQASRRLATTAAMVLVVVTVLSVPVQAAAVTGDGLAGATSAPALGEVLSSTFGVSAAVRLIGAAALLVFWAVAAPVGVLVVGGLTTLGSFVLDGHQRTVEPTWLLTGAGVVHLVAAAVWVAGLVLLAGSLRRRSVADDPVVAAETISRFSSLGVICVGFAAFAGVAMAVPLVGTPAALTATTYGWLLVAKTLLVLVVVGLAAYNRQRLVPAIVMRATPTGGSLDTVDRPGESTTSTAERAWSRLHRTVRVEAALLVAVLLVTGVLVTVQPASEAAGRGGWYETTARLDEQHEVDLVVDPNRAGRNTIHLYVLDETGRPAATIEDVELELTYVEQGIGPIGIEPYVAGTGHWIATVDDLTFPGDWEIRVLADDADAQRQEVTVTVPVAP